MARLSDLDNRIRKAADSQENGIDAARDLGSSDVVILR